MTDEEKKEYEELKSLLYTGTITQYGKRKLIDVIDKLFKEIEELKTTKKELTERVLRLESDKFWENVVSKDKIKAKIEEIKDEFKEYENGQEWEIQDEIRGQIEVLESLLEKE